MEIAVINFTKVVGSNTIQSSSHIAWWISKKLKATIIDTKEACYPTKYDWIFIVNGPLLYCGFREELVRLCELNENYVWIGNDYAIEIPSNIKFIKDRNLHYWCGYENFKSVPNHSLINWNVLRYAGLPTKVGGEVKHTGLAYYGAFRQDREKYFAKYFRTNKYDVYVSTSRQAKGKFRQLNPNIKFFTLKNIPRQFGQFEATIYIEDVRNNSMYCHPANRFYECLSAGVVQFFDKSTEHTFIRAKYPVEPFVDSADEVGRYLGDHETMIKLYEIQKEIHKNFHSEVEIKFSELIKKISPHGV